LAVAAFAILSLGAASPSVAEDAVVFRVCHNDENDIGSHRVLRTVQGDETIVETTVDLSVDILFLVAWSFDSAQKEIWRDGRLIAFESRTLDDGEDHIVRAAATADGLDMDGHEHRTLFPADAGPENFWDPAIRSRSVLFDTKKGRRRDVRFIDDGADGIRIDGRMTPARRWRIEGDIDRTLWYGKDDQLLRVDFVEKDRAFTIRRGVCGGG